MLHICHSCEGRNDNRRLLLSIFIHVFDLKSDEYWFNKAFQNSQREDFRYFLLPISQGEAISLSFLVYPTGWWAWIFDGRERETRRASGWPGTMSLPRVLWLGEDKTLKMCPPEELEALRYNPKKMESLTLEAGSELTLKDVAGNSLELNGEMVPDGAEQFGVQVCCSPDGEEQTAILYDAGEKKLKIDTTKSSLGEGPKSVEGGPFELKPGESLDLRVFVDKSVVEIFTNDRQGIMRRIYPTRADSLSVRLFSKGGATKVNSIQAWDMSPANPW